MYIKNSNGPTSFEPCGTTALTLFYIETCSFKTAPCFLFLQKSHNKFESSADMLFCFDLKIILSCQTLSNTFDVCRKALLTLNPTLNDLYISCVIEVKVG